MKPRRLLVVSYFHPPFPGSGGNRWMAMARHLRRAGHDVTILASGAFGGLPDDSGVIRVADLKSAGPLRRLLGRGELPAPGAAPALEPPAPALLTKVVVPDAHLASWIPGVLVAARRLVARGRVDCLVTTGPPESAHLVGLALGRRRPAWIADFRDGWTFEPLREPFPLAVQRRLDRAMERRVATTAEVVAGATRPIADDLASRLGAHAVWVPNAWDPETGDEAARAPELPPGVNLVHTGTLSGAWGRDPEPLLRALAEVPGVRLVLAGRLTPQEEALIDRAGVRERVVHLGMLDRAGSLALQRAADALLLITSPNAGEATGKVFEYLAAGRPILALAAGSEAGAIVRDTGTGVTVAPDDHAGIVAALRRLAAGTLDYAPAGLERFTYPGPAETMAELVELALRRRGQARDARGFRTTA